MELFYLAMESCKNIIKFAQLWVGERLKLRCEWETFKRMRSGLLGKMLTGRSVPLKTISEFVNIAFSKSGRTPYDSDVVSEMFQSTYQKYTVSAGIAGLGFC